jgi:TolA-binding protein
MNDLQVPLGPVIEKLADKLRAAEVRIASLETFIEVMQQQQQMEAQVSTAVQQEEAFQNVASYETMYETGDE